MRQGYLISNKSNMRIIDGLSVLLAFDAYNLKKVRAHMHSTRARACCHARIYPCAARAQGLVAMRARTHAQHVRKDVLPCVHTCTALAAALVFLVHAVVTVINNK